MYTNLLEIMFKSHRRFVSIINYVLISLEIIKILFAQACFYDTLFILSIIVRRVMALHAL